MNSFELYSIFRRCQYYFSTNNSKRYFRSVGSLKTWINNQDPKHTTAIPYFVKGFEKLLTEIKELTIDDLIFSFSYIFYKKKTIDIFELDYYHLNKPREIVSESQIEYDKTVLKNWCEELGIDSIKKLLEIKKSGTNLFYDLIKNEYITEGLYIKMHGEYIQMYGKEIQSNEFKLFSKKIGLLHLINEGVQNASELGSNDEKDAGTGIKTH